MKTLECTKSYRGGFRLELPALTLEPGELTAVIGANGSGKTTMARLLAGTEKSDQGARPLSSVSVGYLPQKPYLFRMSTGKNIRLGGDDAERFADLTQQLALRNLLHQRARSLSGGETAKTALARLLMRRWQLLILDEPCTAMDEESTLAAEALLRRRCREEGSAVLLITHSLSQARRCADRVIFLKNGNVLEQGSAENLLSAPETPELRRFLSFY